MEKSYNTLLFKTISTCNIIVDINIALCYFMHDISILTSLSKGLLSGGGNMEWEIDNLLQYPEPFRMSEDQAAESKLKAFVQIFEHHYKNCPEYRNYCALYNLSPQDIKTPNDLIKIQPIPSDVFRDSEKLILSVPEDRIALVTTTSSTTSKKPCKYALDVDSLRRTSLTGIHFLKDVGVKDGFVCMLTPSPEESDTGMVSGWSHVLKEGLKFGDRIMYAVNKGKIETENVLRTITTTKYRPAHLYGPPFVYMHFADYIVDHKLNLRLDNDSRFVVTGGWKTVAGEITKQEFNERVANAFQVREDQIRGGLGLTDIYSIILECEYHNKHVPPWIHVSARDPMDMNKEVDEGGEGMLVLMSSIVTSYPAFVLPGDMGAVWNNKKCRCGRTGQIVEHRGRGSKLGARGCAIRLEQFMDTITRK
jgi:long-chain-fatty-acid---luciferin-component ligase